MRFWFFSLISSDAQCPPQDAQNTDVVNGRVRSTNERAYIVGQFADVTERLAAIGRRVAVWPMMSSMPFVGILIGVFEFEIEQTTENSFTQ